MKIVIASGKGGTGKTTVSVNMALALAESRKVRLLDCDVEEPNDNLFLGLGLEKVKEVSIFVPEIDKNRCTYCGKCADFCAYNAIAVVPNSYLIFEELCHGCGGCAIVCPEGAISEKARNIGIVEHGKKGNLEFYQGLLNVGEPMATPVVRAVKSFLGHVDKVDASSSDHILTLIDAPPGAGCAVLETLKESDFCVLVTEPTPFGLYDLNIAVEVARNLGILFGVIINRDGMGTDDGRGAGESAGATADAGGRKLKDASLVAVPGLPYSTVDEYCEGEGIPILMRIPHDRRIAELYSKGEPFSLVLDGWKEKFETLHNDIKTLAAATFRGGKKETEKVIE